MGSNDPGAVIQTQLEYSSTEEGSLICASQKDMTCYRNNVLGLFLCFVYVYFKCCSKRRKATFWVQGAAGVTFQSFLIFFFLLKDKSSRSVEVIRITPLSGMNACTALCNSPSHGCLDMLKKTKEVLSWWCLRKSQSQ